MYEKQNCLDNQLGLEQDLMELKNANAESANIVSERNEVIADRQGCKL